MNSTQSAKMVWRRYGWTVAPKGFSYGPSMAATFWPDSFRSLGPFWSKLCGPDITTISEPDFELTDWYGADEYDLDNHMERMRQPHLNQTFEVKKNSTIFQESNPGHPFLEASILPLSHRFIYTVLSFLYKLYCAHQKHYI